MAFAAGPESSPLLVELGSTSLESASLLLAAISAASKPDTARQRWRAVSSDVTECELLCAMAV